MSAVRRLYRWWMPPMIVAAMVLASQVIITFDRSLGSFPQVFAQTPDSIAEAQFQAQEAVAAAPVHLNLATSAQPATPTPQQIADAEAWIGQTHRPGVMQAQDANIGGPPEGSGTSASQIELAASPGPAAPGTFIALQSSPLNPGAGGLSSSHINEPSVAQEGGYVFYTGNWYAARSDCGGNDYGFPQFCGGGSWQYINPYADFPDFCCDQDVVKDNRRQIFLWYRQGVFNHPSGPPNQNRFRLGVSYDGFGPFGGCFYNFRPVDVDATWTNQWFDYPHLAVSNDFLWILTNVFNAAGGFVRSVVFKMPLDPLAACAGFGYQFFVPDANGWGVLVQGAKTQMYWASHRGFNNQLRIWWWNEDSGTIFAVDRAIPAFTFQNRNGVCTARPAGSLNWVRRGDSRLLAGWVRQVHPTIPATANETVGQLGFMWNANAGGGFPQPYTEAATFRQDNLAVSGRPFVWGGDCWQYAFASPNYADDLGVTITLSNNSLHPSTWFLVDDDYNGVPPGWENYALRFGGGGTFGCSSNPEGCWGDYVRNRPVNPKGKMWVSSGHTIQGGAVEPRYYVVGRERDQNSYWKYIWSRW